MRDHLRSQRNFDTDWTDLFWKYRNDKDEIDDYFLNFLTNVTINFCLLKDNNFIKNKKTRLRDFDKLNIIDLYEEVYTSENLVNLEKLLDSLKDNHTNKTINKYFEIFIGKNDSESNEDSDSLKISGFDRLKFFAISSFLIFNDFFENNFKKFIRVFLIL